MEPVEVTRSFKVGHVSSEYCRRRCTVSQAREPLELRSSAPVNLFFIITSPVEDVQCSIYRSLCLFNFELLRVPFLLDFYKYFYASSLSKPVSRAKHCKPILTKCEVD
jgi:hypothetical protein